MLREGQVDRAGSEDVDGPTVRRDASWPCEHKAVVAIRSNAVAGKVCLRNLDMSRSSLRKGHCD